MSKKIEICDVVKNVHDYFLAKDYGLTCKNEERLKDIKKSYCYEEGDEDKECSNFTKTNCY